MVCAKLHIICGNCGCNDQWELEIEESDNEDEKTLYLICRNCSTLHNLYDYAERINPNQQQKDNNGI